MIATTDLTCLGQMLVRACRTWPSNTAFLVPIQKKHQPITFEKHLENVLKYAAALKEIGIGEGDVFNIFSENMYEWSVADWAGQVLGAVPVPIYPSLPSDQASYIVNDCKSKLVLCGSDALIARVEQTGVQAMLLAGPGSLDERAQSAPALPADWEAQMENRSRDSLATIIYTSGTTGLPKGAMLTQDNFLHMMDQIPSAIPLRDSDVFMSFLPLSHVYERVNGHVLPMFLGACVGYVQSYATVASDFLAIRPTVMLTVPRFLDALRTRILDATEKAPPVRKKLFYAALSAGVRKMRGQSAPLQPLLQKIVGAKIQERIGGRFRFFVSGGAALPAQTAEFFGAFGIPVLQGYGLTETTSGMMINRLDDNDYRTIGIPIGDCQVKLEADGEILIKGRCNMKGYFNLPKETAEVFTEDGWFRSGDIGQWEGNKLKITDRKKDLLVLINGKNVAPQPIENMLRESPLIAEAVLLGDGMEVVCALIVPDFEAVQKVARLEGLSTADPSQLIQLDAVRKIIKAEIDKTNKKLAEFEKVKRHVLLTKPFSIESGELTPSMKVKRNVVKERYAEEIRSMSRQ